MTTCRDRLGEVLRAQGIRYTNNPLDREMVVKGSLKLEGSGLTALPEDLCVQGSLDLTNSDLTELPQWLAVSNSMLLRGGRITTLPDTLSVGASMILSHSNITELPEGFQVNGMIDLSHSPISELPEKMYVRGDLKIGETRIRHLPKEMFVGGAIFPPSELQDIQDFMARHSDDEVRLVMEGPHHQRMQLRYQLAALHDLNRIVESIAPHRCLRINRTGPGQYAINIEGQDPA